MRERVVIQQLHGDRRRELFRGLEQTHEQRGANEVVHQTFAQPELDEQVVRGHPVVRLERLVVPAQVEHSVQQADHRDAVLQREPLEVVERREHLAKRRGQLRVVAAAEHRRGGLEAVGGKERGRGEVRKHVGLADAQLGERRLDVRVILPEPARTVLEGLARGGGARSHARGVGDAVQQRHVAPSLAQCLGGAESAPAGAHDGHLRLAFGRGGGAIFRFRFRFGRGADDHASAASRRAARGRERAHRAHGGDVCHRAHRVRSFARQGAHVAPPVVASTQKRKRETRGLARNESHELRRSDFFRARLVPSPRALRHNARHTRWWPSSRRAGSSWARRGRRAPPGVPLAWEAETRVAPAAPHTSLARASFRCGTRRRLR